MSAPELPETFGNYALGEFVEVLAPSAVSWLPQTTGWLWLAIVLLLLVLRVLYKQLRQWYHNRYRREAERRLQRLKQCSSSDSFLRDVNQLLKLTAMVAFGRQSVARLSGIDWVEFLNAQCSEPPFTSEQEQLLANGTYGGEPPSEAARNQLLMACLKWVSSHEKQAHV